MSISLSQLVFIGLTYLFTLFFTAYVVEKGWIPRRIVQHPVVYVLSLGVYASAWAFYGSVGMAYTYGYGFLAYYIGISGAFILAPILLKPILRITRNYQLSSLADLFAFRYRSRTAGALVTLFMLVGILPLLALQISAIAKSIYLLNNELSQDYLGLGFCIVMVIFAILFGARHVSPREKHEGLVFAIAFETLLKMVCLVAVGLYALFVVFDGPADLSLWLSANTELLNSIHKPMTEGPWRTLLLVFFAAAIVMPHMFHMGFTENINPDGLNRASWGMPLLLLIMGAAVPLILWAGIKLNISTGADYFTLGIGLVQENKLLAIVAFTGGLAASSGIIIVTTLALAAMFLNHVVLPIHQPSTKNDIYSWLLWTRRCLIAAIILAGYLCYKFLGPKLSLAELGIISFVATLQFLPGVIGVLYWPHANRRGFITGLSLGIVIWTFTMLLPVLGVIDEIQIWGYTLTADHDNWYIAALTSFAANLVAFVLVSLIFEPSHSEKTAAEACSVDALSTPERRELEAETSNDFIDSLAKPLGQHVAQREVMQALLDLKLPSFENRPYALRRLRGKVEVNLSGLLGPSVAHDIVTRHLSYKAQGDKPINEDIHFIEKGLEGYHRRLTGLAGELDNLRRYHRQTLENLPMGVCSLAIDKEILMWNRAMENLTGISSDEIIGSRVTSLPAPWSTMFMDFSLDESAHQHKKAVEIDERPRWFNLHKAMIEEPVSHRNDGLVILLEDQTETQLLEDELVHSERLASIGRLAAGVAHEIGNPITGIACLAQNLDYDCEDPEIVKETAQQILDQTLRVTRIVQSLVNFAHAGSQHEAHELLPVDIYQCVSEAVDLIKLSNKGKDLIYTNDVATDLQVTGDMQRLLQVFVNLLSNARDASQDNETIHITSHATEHTAVINVIDEGEGIPANKLDQIFDPFFTTKEVGTGTGLGLSLVYSIIEEHFGHIAIESPASSETKKGTKVIITLPIHHPLDDSTEASQA